MAGPGGLEFPMLIDPDLGQAVLQAGRDGWMRGLFSGFNGNISVRRGDRMIITSTGSAKGHLTADDLAVVDVHTGRVLSETRPSSELGVHLEIYRGRPQTQAVVHTHPPSLIALFLTGGTLDLPFLKAECTLKKMTRVPFLSPVRPSWLAVGQAARDAEAVFMDRHGLVCREKTSFRPLALSESWKAWPKLLWSFKKRRRAFSRHDLSRRGK